MRAEIIAIGDEITSGQTLDTNSQWLSQRLEELGIRVLYHTTVGDELESMIDVFRTAIGRAETVVVTGGLGPTADDLTREALAAVLERELLLDESALEHIRSLFARRRREMPERNRVQAMFPAGSRVVFNPHGTAPGIHAEVTCAGRPPTQVFALPGVPAELQEMWPAVAAALRRTGGGLRVVRHRKINCFGAGESHLESMLGDLIRRGRDPRVGITASQATISLRITAEAASDDECREKIEPTARLIYQSLGNLVYGEEDETLQDAVVRLLAEQRLTLATSECGTRGLVADWLGGVAGGEVSYRGGEIVASVEMGQAQDGGAKVHERVQRMAADCRLRFGAEIGLAVGPFPPVGPDPVAASPLVLGLAMGNKVRTIEVPFAAHPALVRILSAKQALNLMRLALLEAASTQAPT
jgi:nicotinamide-nucleotide amidase